MNEQVKSKEDEIIVQIARRPDVTQRELASNAGISLGMTNIILKRLAHKGYVKMKRLNRRNIKYILTPTGLAHYSRRSYSYLVGTISSVRQLRQKIKDIVGEWVEKGSPGFVVHGDGDLADIAELALRDLEGETGVHWTRKESPKGWVHLMCDASEEDTIGDQEANGGTDMESGNLNLGRAILENES